MHLFTVGATYAAVPLYRIFCQETGYGGTTQKGHDKSKVGDMKVTFLMWIFIINFPYPNLGVLKIYL